LRKKMQKELIARNKAEKMNAFGRVFSGIIIGVLKLLTETAS
jgi:hypothetical protein